MTSIMQDKWDTFLLHTPFSHYDLLWVKKKKKHHHTVGSTFTTWPQKSLAPDQQHVDVGPTHDSSILFFILQLFPYKLLLIMEATALCTLLQQKMQGSLAARDAFVDPKYRIGSPFRARHTGHGRDIGRNVVPVRASVTGVPLKNGLARRPQNAEGEFFVGNKHLLYLLNFLFYSS